MNGKIRFWLLGVAGCLILAAAWAVLVDPGTALAKGKPNNKGNFNNQGYWVWFSQDPLGAFGPEGPPPEGSALNGTNLGSFDVVAGSIADPNDQRMLINFNQTCLVSGFPKADPAFLLLDDDIAMPDDQSIDDFLACFPVPSVGRTMSIPADGTTVQMNIAGLSKSGHDLLYRLTIYVTDIDFGNGPIPIADVIWDPLGIDPGTSATLFFGHWELTTFQPKQQSKGCSASGDFSDDVDPFTGAVGTTITVSRWTLDEQAAQDACE